MKERSVSVFAPATIANLGPGIDVLGIALTMPGDVVLASRTEEPGFTFKVQSKDADLPGDAKKNVAGHVANLMIKEFKPTFGIDLLLKKQMPIGSGLGSSAASSVAAAVAVNALLSRPLKRPDLLRFVAEGERLTSGAAHLDNVAPSLLGGACLIRNSNPPDVLTLPLRNKIWWVVASPELVVTTREARKNLPKSLPLKRAIQQWGHVAGVVAGLAQGSATTVGSSLVDAVAEPVRGPLIEGFHAVKAAALKAGAPGAAIAGSGASVFAVTQSEVDGRRIGRAMQRAFRDEAGVASKIYVSRINTTGAEVEVSS